MSAEGFDTYRKSNVASFTHGSVRVVLDQSTPLPLAEAEQVSIQADKVMGQLVYTAFRVGSSISDFVVDKGVAEGSSYTEGAAWQEVGKLHIRARVSVSVVRSVPEFILAEAVDLTLQHFRTHVRAELDPSYKAYLAEEEARKAAVHFDGLLATGDPVDAFVFLSSMLGDDALFGFDGLGGAMAGRPFGPFGRGKRFAG